MTDREELEQAMAALDKQRTVLGDTAVEAALAGLRQKLSALEKGEPASPALAGERRVVTVLFCDVKGSTAMAEKLDPEEWAGIMKRAFTFLIPPVTRHDGIVARLMGDAILAFFGAPTAHEDDPKRAVRAGLEIVEGITVFREQLKRERGLDFNVRVGINTGLVFVGAIGADRRVEYTAVGDTMNLAARMEQTAQPGSVQITEQTFKLVEPWFEFEALGGIQVKGKSEPVITYRVLRVKASPARGHGLERHGLSAPLVGRRRELETIESCLQQLDKRGEGCIVSIIGEAGLGKSRLVSEAKSFAIANNPKVLWLEGQTLSFGQTISYWPFQQILRSWVDITEDDNSDASWMKLESHIRGLFAEATIDYLPYLASLLALEVRGEYAERVKYLDGDAIGKQIFLTSRRFFERLARTQPTVLVFEDLHWMDKSSTLLLEHLLSLVGTVPLAIFGISRPERETPAARLRELCARDFAERYTEIRLEPLSESDSVELMDHLLEIENMPAHLRELIVEKADGNPFFLEEVLRTLMDMGMVTRDASSGHWRATANVETIQIPNTIQGVIMARLDRLDEELKLVLRMASVIGRSFLYRVLKTITDSGRRLDEDLTELQATELIREKQHLPELEYMFKHALAQEATYESILIAKRRELHGRVAHAIESLFAGRLEEFYGLLAYHYAQAETWSQAQEYLLKAADRAGQMAADAEALNLYQQAMAAYARAFGDKWDPIQRASLERKIGESYFGLGKFDESIEHLKRAVGLLGHAMPDTRLKMVTSIAGDMFRQTLRRVFPKHLTPETLSDPRKGSAHFLEATRAYERLVEIYYESNQLFSYICACFRTLDLAEEIGTSPELARAYATNSMNTGIMGLHAFARYYERRAWEIANRMSDPSALSWVLLNTAVYRLEISDWAQSRMRLETGLKIVEGIGDLRRRDVIGATLAWQTHCQGDLTGAMERWPKIYHDARARGDANAAIWGLGGHSESWMAISGPTDQILGLLMQAKALLATERFDLPDEIHVFGLLARVYLYRGEIKLAQESAERCASAIAKTMPTTFYSFEGYAHVAETFLELWRTTEGQSQVADLKAKSRQCCHALMGYARVFTWARPRAWLWQGVCEWQEHNRSAGRSAWKKSLAAAQKLALPYEEGLARLEIGRRLGEHEQLKKAETIFTDIGAEWDLARTRELLAP